jgi:hypothetical protein
MKPFPQASLAGMSGLPPDRVARLLDGNVTPRPSEAMAHDSALGTNAARHLPKKTSHTYVGRPFLGMRPDREILGKSHALTGPRQQRVDAWAARVAAHGLTLAAIAAAAGLGLGRTVANFTAARD